MLFLCNFLNTIANTVFRSLEFRKQIFFLIMSWKFQTLQSERKTLLKLWLEIKYARWSLGPLRWLSDFFCHVAQTDLCSLRPTAAHPSGHTCALSFLDIKKIAFSRLHNGRGYSQSALPLTLWKNLIFMLNVKQSSNVFDSNTKIERWHFLIGL